MSPNEKTLSDLSIKSGSTVVLLIRPPKNLVEPVKEVKKEVAQQPQQQLPNSIPQNNQPNIEQNYAQALQQNPQMFMQMLMTDPTNSTKKWPMLILKDL